MVCKIFITLKTILLKTQIIVTTHSPHILQIDSKEEMIVLDMAESDNVYKKELELGEYGVLGKTQIIVTTHSPHILQIDSKEEMIVLDMAESDNVYKKELELGEYGVLGWTNEGLYLH